MLEMSSKGEESGAEDGKGGQGRWYTYILQRQQSHSYLSLPRASWWKGRDAKTHFR